MRTTRVEVSDLQKVLDVVKQAHEHHRERDASNARLHLAREVRYSPLTSELGAAVDRLQNLLLGPECSCGPDAAKGNPDARVPHA